MSIRAKFTCQAVRKDMYGNEGVELFASHGKGNESWAKATPGGNLTMTISNPEAQGQIVPGKSYYLDIAEAPAEG